jgi:signal transduction histidine kinase
VAACAGLLLAGCGTHTDDVAPSVKFTRIPPAEQGGAARLDRIEGRVRGARVGQRVVLYARSGIWYVQPFADQPFTQVQPDSTWASPTHLGTEYAALLVDGDYRPPATLDMLPRPGAGVVSVTSVEGTPALWRALWFQVSCVLAVAAAAWAFHRFRVNALTRQLNIRAEERLAERTLVAQELYDTLLQGFLSASMQLHLTVDELPEGSPERRRVEHVLGTMGQVVEEGRHVLRGLRCWGDDADHLRELLSRVGEELAADDGVEFRVRVEGTARAVHPVIREEVHRVGREALLNAFRHAQARGVQVEIAYSSRALRLLVRDDGCGIDSTVLESRREGTSGLATMRERAERIGGRFRVRTRAGAGTEVELSVPGAIAFRSPPPDGETKRATE